MNQKTHHYLTSILKLLHRNATSHRDKLLLFIITMKPLTSLAFLIFIYLTATSALTARPQAREIVPPPHIQCPNPPNAPADDFIIDFWSSANCAPGTHLYTSSGTPYNEPVTGDVSFTSMNSSRALLAFEKLELEWGLGEKKSPVGVYSQKGVIWESGLDGTGDNVLQAGLCQAVPPSNAFTLAFDYCED